MPGLRGLNGRPEVVEQLVAALDAGRGVQRMAQGLYRLDELTSPTGVPGTAARADTGHRELAREWFTAFTVNTLERGKRDMAQVADWAIRGSMAVENRCPALRGGRWPGAAGRGAGAPIGPLRPPRLMPRRRSWLECAVRRGGCGHRSPRLEQWLG